MQTNDKFAIYDHTAGTQPLTILPTSGNVGIGTTSPATKLNVVSSSGAQLQVSGWSDRVGSNNNANGTIYIGNTAAYRGVIDYDAASTGALIISNTWNNANGDIIFKTATAGTAIEGLRIKGGGNVGIGTTNPTEKLEINGNTYTRSKTRGIATNYATSEGWAASTAVSSAVGYFGGNFNSNGGSSENKIEYDIGPFGLRELIWKTIPETVSNDDGGWNKAMDSFNNSAANGFISVVYVKRSSSASTGNFYHGCSGSSTNNLNGSANTNPYFNAFGVGTLPENVWCVSIGVIYAANDSNTTTSTLGGVYRLDTGVKITSSTTFRQKPSNTQQQQRVYHYYSTSPTAKLDFAKPAFYVTDGSEPTLSELTAGAAGGDDVYWTANGNDIYNDNTGNVGIGTTNPVNKLDVAGIVRVAESSNVAFYAGNYVRVFGDQNYGFRDSGGTYKAQISMSGNSYFNGGNVGIGTASPSAKLDVSVTPSAAGINLINGNETAFRLTSYNNGTNNGSNAYAFKHGLYYNTTENAAVTFYRGGGSTGGFLTFTTNAGSERMRINSAGNVGIGTTSPDSKLSVTSSTINSEDILYLKSGADSVNDYLGIAWEIGAGGNGPHSAIRSFAGPSGSDARLGFLTTSNGGTTLTEGLSVAHNGNVGIGTTSPSARLDVKTAVAPFVGLKVSDYGTNPNALYAGVVADTSMFFGSGYYYNSNQYRTLGTAAAITRYEAGNFTVFTDASLTANTNYTPTERMRIDSAGKIKIGNNIPMWSGSYGGALFLKGNNATSDRYAQLTEVDSTGAATNTGLVVRAGNVGIGTTGPSEKLDIRGGDLQIYNSYASGVQIKMAHYDPAAGTTYDSSIIKSVLDAISPQDAGSSMLRFYTNKNSTTNSAVALDLTKDKNAIFYGNVGIGTTNPSTELHVAGDIRVGGSTSLLDLDAGAKIVGQYYGNGGAELTFLRMYNNSDASINMGTKHSQGYISFAAGSGAYTERMRIKNDGNVGIGTTNPTARLDVSSSPNSNQLFLKDSSDGDITHNFWVDSVGHGQFWMYPEGQGVPKVRISTNDISYFNGGNVGIGTTNPTAKITLADHTTAAGGIKFRTASSSVSLWSSGSGNLNTDNSFNVGSRLRLVGGNAVADPDIGFTGATAGTGFSRAGQDITFVSGGAERMRLDNDGNLGISTANPNRLLQINGGHGTTRMRLFYAGSQNDRNAYIDMWASEPGVTYNGSGMGSNINGSPYYGRYVTELGQSYIRFVEGQLELWTGPASSGTASTALQRLTIKSDGNVGIGIANPSYPLEVADAGTVSIAYQRTGVSAKKWGFHSDNSNTYWQNITDGVMGLTVSNAGRIGIGTLSPESKLHVIDSNSSTQLRLNQSGDNDAVLGSGTNFFTIKTGTAGNTNALSILHSNQNVGIGTTSPSQKLDVNGAAIFGAGATRLTTYSDSGYAGIYNGSSLTSDESIYMGGGNTFFYANNAERMRINSSGNVGIGTTNPDARLRLKGAGGSSGLTFKTTDASNNETFYVFDGGRAGVRYHPFSIGIPSTTSVATNAVFQVEEAGLLTVLSTGNVGIGTASPKGKLHVLDGTAGSYSPDSEADTVVIESSVAGGISLIGTGSSSERKQKIVFGTTGNTTGAVVIYDPNNSFMSIGPTAASNFLKLLTGNGTEAMRLAADGNVGIGTTSPAQKLDIGAGHIRLDAGYSLQWDNSHERIEQSDGHLEFFVNNGEAMTLDTNGIDVNGLTTANAFRSDVNNTDYSLFTRNSANNAVVYFQSVNSVANQPIAFFSYGSTTAAQGYKVLVVGKDKSYFDNTNLGIGTTNPTYKLDVAGSARIEGDLDLGVGFKIANYSGSYWQRIRTEDASASTTNAFNFETRNGSGSFIDHMVIRNDGNVGIGVTNPSYTLQVGGSIVGTSKSFLIKHPTKEGKKLLHACIEGPENGVYYRGKSTSSILEMPDYWIGLVHIDSMTVDITAIGPNQDIYVDSISDDGDVTIGSNTDVPLNYFYVIYGERKDIGKLEIEIVDPEYAN